MTPVTLDRTGPHTATLTNAEGLVWDVYGSSWAEMKEDAEAVAAFEGLTIEMFNSELPEA